MPELLRFPRHFEYDGAKSGPQGDFPGKTEKIYRVVWFIEGLTIDPKQYIDLAAVDSRLELAQRSMASDY